MNDKIIEILEGKKREGMLIVISAPSGTGKTTLCRRLVSDDSRLRYSVSVTTRPPRPGEEDGKDYFFTDIPGFEDMISRGGLVEWARVHGNYYGTSKDFVERNLNEGNHIILDIDVQGGMQIRERYPRAVLLFVMPPSMEELERRLRRRNQDTADEIEKRLNNSIREIEAAFNYDYLVVNEDIEKAVKRVESIISAEECRIYR